MSCFLRNLLLLQLCLLVVFSLPAFAGPLPLQPLQVSNQAPLAVLCGLPTAGRPRLLAEDDYETALSWNLASNFSSGNIGQEQLLFDGEMHRVALRIDRGFADGWELGLEIPLIAHRGGFLDGFIEGWHDFFGLPQGGRADAPRDQLDYHYLNGNEPLELSQKTTGLGDVGLFIGHQITSDTDSALAVHASLELPTGDESEWHGSGSLDASVRLSGEKLWHNEKQRAGLFYSGGLLLSDGNGVLSEQRQKIAGIASLGLAWSMWQNILFQFQFDGHTSLFSDSELRQIGDASLQLAIGGAVAVSETTRCELAVVEDIAVDTAPDVTFYLRLSRRF